MKIKQGFVMRNVAEQAVAVATGEASKTFHGMIKLNATGAKIWRGIEEGLDAPAIAERLADEYSISPEHAQKDVDTFIERMRKTGLMED